MFGKGGKIFTLYLTRLCLVNYVGSAEADQNLLETYFTTHIKR